MRNREKKRQYRKRAALLLIAAIFTFASLPVDEVNASSFSSHKVKFERIINARDLGGYKTKDGTRKVKKGMILRTSELSYASEKDRNKIQKTYKIKKVYDFRYSADCKKCPDKKIKGISYINIPAKSGKGSKKRAKKRYRSLKKKKGKSFRKAFTRKGKKCSRSYTTSLIMSEHSRKAYKRYFESLLKNDKPVILHCVNGKDRTGVAAFMTLIALGVSEEDAYQDYRMTNTAVKEIFPKKKDRKKLGVRESDLRYAVKKAKKKYGSLDNFLKKAYGLDKGKRDKLREIYTEPLQ